MKNRVFLTGSAGHGSRVRGILGYGPSWFNRSSPEIHWDRKKSLEDRTSDDPTHQSGSTALTGSQVSARVWRVTDHGLAENRLLAIGNLVAAVAVVWFHRRRPTDNDPLIGSSISASHCLSFLLNLLSHLTISQTHDLSLILSLSRIPVSLGQKEERRRKEERRGRGLLIY
jgi:hypothetical protein